MNEREVGQVMWTNCVRCPGDKKHEILGVTEQSADEDGINLNIYAIVQCRGCDNISFIREAHDRMNGYYDRDLGGEYVYDKKLTAFPSYDLNNDRIDGEWLIPKLVGSVLREARVAHREKLNVLAALGSRATIEAICVDKTIAGKDLLEKIDGMQAAGLITQSDANLLHGIRYIGNDAAHEFRSAKTEELDAVFKIISHVIQSLYVIPGSVGQHLNPQITTLNEALPFIEKGSKALAKGNEYTIHALMQTEARRLPRNASALEAELIAHIAAGTTLGLKTGSTQTALKSKRSIQMFEVI